jgi:hypothetical protein
MLLETTVATVSPWDPFVPKRPGRHPDHLGAGVCLRAGVCRVPSSCAARSLFWTDHYHAMLVAWARGLLHQMGTSFWL